MADMETDDRVIPGRYKPRPKPLRFKETDFAYDGFIAMAANYTNGSRQKFVVTIAAEVADRKDLEAYADELKVWIRAELPDPRAQARRERRRDRELRRLLGPPDYGRVSGSRVALTVEVDELPGVERGQPVIVYWRIDPSVANGGEKSFSGPDVVIASVQDGRIQLSGLTYAPHSIPVGAASVRDANGYCKVVGLQRSDFTLDSRQGRGPWTER